MPNHEDSLGGETFSGEEQQDPAEQSLGDGATMGGDTSAHSLGDQSTFGDANVDDELFDEGMKLEDLSERYTEEGVLGKGGMGEVILATDTRLNRKVAIKRIIGKAARSKTAVQRFLTEAQSMAELSHTNIVQIYDYGRATDGPFLIMECIQGGSLLEKCKAGPIEIDEAVSIFGQLCDGLAKAHAAGIIHRDIKPANVLMTEDGIPKLTDFGLAKDDTADTRMTMEGAVIGTLDFMPPEQRQAAELTDHRSDLWSLAATFYQMLTGKSPKVINISAIPPELQSVLAKALEESKEERFQSAHEMKEAVLQAATAGLNASRDLGEGECPSCGTTNASDRKFCRNTECAASLEVDCLSCKTAMPMWEGVCGSCGTKQDALIDEAKEVLQRKHDEAEVFLNELMFDDALQVSSVIGEQNDLRLQQFAAWHEEFSARLESSKTSEHARLEELLGEAHAHEQAYDYEAGLQTLTQVAPSLKQTTVSGNEDTADVLTERLTTKQSSLKELEGIVRERVGKREITGLLPIVNDLLTLKPDRPEVQKLKEQLEKRDADLLEARDAAIKQATQQLSEQQYAEAVATLNTVSEEVSSEQLEELKTKASELLKQLNTLRDRITTAVNGNQLKDLLPAVQECLTLKSDQDDLVKLKQDLIDREAQMDARNQQIISQAQQHMQQLQFDAVVQVLDTITPQYQTLTTTGLSQQAHQMSVQRQGVLNAVPVALSKKDYQVAIKSISQYLGEIANAGLQDPQLQQMLDEAKGKESASIRNKKLVKLGIAAACVVMVLITGVVIKINLDAKAAAEKAAILAGGPITNTIGMTFNNIPAGTFLWGKKDAPQHKVTITKAFYMQTTEVTQGQWQAVMGSKPWKGDDNVKEGPDYPATDVRWDDAVAYCKKLSEKEGKTYRLPTEAEWEYACRAGTETAWSFGDDERELGDYAWYRENTSDIGEEYAHQVGLKKPNAFGLYDMHGNVDEWCHDYYEKDYYKQSPGKDPTGPMSGSYRVLRGGSWFYGSHGTRSADRDGTGADFWMIGQRRGFRLVRELDSNNAEELRLQDAAEKVTAGKSAMEKGALDIDKIQQAFNTAKSNLIANVLTAKNLEKSGATYVFLPHTGPSAKDISDQAGKLGGTPKIGTALQEKFVYLREQSFKEGGLPKADPGAAAIVDGIATKLLGQYGADYKKLTDGLSPAEEHVFYLMRVEGLLTKSRTEFDQLLGRVKQVDSEKARDLEVKITVERNLIVGILKTSKGSELRAAVINANKVPTPNTQKAKIASSLKADTYHALIVEMFDGNPLTVAAGFIPAEKTYNLSTNSLYANRNPLVEIGLRGFAGPSLHTWLKHFVTKRTATQVPTINDKTNIYPICWLGIAMGKTSAERVKSEVKFKFEGGKYIAKLDHGTIGIVIEIDTMPNRSDYEFYKLSVAPKGIEDGGSLKNNLLAFDKSKGLYITYGRPGAAKLQESRVAFIDRDEEIRKANIGQSSDGQPSTSFVASGVRPAGYMLVTSDN